MKYEIHKLVTPQVLQKKEMTPFFKVVTNRTVLERLDVTGVQTSHDTMEEALKEIEKHSQVLKNQVLTVIPILLIDDNGKVF